uniref:Uncharacterized protein n=1 Tax=Hyaloperonospora arabidopsidis (strain Emoy2) TaxID=559515 RepID=M4BI89_HYAAE
MCAGGSEWFSAESGSEPPTVTEVSLFPDTDSVSVSESEDPNIARFNEVFVANADPVAEAAVDAAPRWFAGRIGHLTAGELEDWLDSAEAEGFATLAGRRIEDHDMAKVARTTSLSTLEPPSKGYNSTRYEGPQDVSEGRIDEAGVADARSFEVFFE